MKPVAWHFPEDDPVSVSCAFAKVFGMKCSVLNGRLRSISFYLFTLNFSTGTVQPFLRGRLICNHFMEKKLQSLCSKWRAWNLAASFLISEGYFFVYMEEGKRTTSVHSSAVTFSAKSACVSERRGKGTIFRQGSQEQAKARYTPWSALGAFALPSCRISIGWCGVTTWLWQQVV